MQNSDEPVMSEPCSYLRQCTPWSQHVEIQSTCSIFVWRCDDQTLPCVPDLDTGFARWYFMSGAELMIRCWTDGFRSNEAVKQPNSQNFQQTTERGCVKAQKPVDSDRRRSYFVLKRLVLSPQSWLEIDRSSPWTCAGCFHILHMFL